MTLFEEILFGCLMVGLILGTVFAIIVGFIFGIKFVIDTFRKWGADNGR